MSADIDSPQLSQQKKNKKTKRKDKETSEKKRRHDELEVVKRDADEHSSPSKKRRKHHDSASLETCRDNTHLESSSSQVIAAFTRSTTDSPFALQSTSLYLPVPPIALGDPIRGLCAEHLSPLLLTYYPPLAGVVLAYTDVTLSESALPSNTPDKPILASATDEFAAPFVWVSATFLLFRPCKGTKLPGYVNLQTESHLGLVCFNLFTVSIPRDRLPASWSWAWDEQNGSSEIESQVYENKSEQRPYRAKEQGCWVDENSQRISGAIEFHIQDFETSPWSENEKTFTSIRGSLLDEGSDKIVDKERRQLQEKRKAARDAARMGGAITTNGK